MSQPTKRQFADTYDDRSTSDSYYLVCPYCGYKDDEPYEVSKDLEFCTEVKCCSCDKVFLASRSVIFTYYGCPVVEG